MNVQAPTSSATNISNGWSEAQSKSKRYQQQNPLPPPQSQRLAPNVQALDTPPLSATFGGGYLEFPVGRRTGSPASSIMNGRPGDYRGNPSPPSSVAGGRSSNGSAFVSSDASAAQRRKQSMMEETLGQHYFVLKRYLASTAQDEASDTKPSRARDKLPRLSPTQFQELSTDVYDEFQRRQAVAARQNGAASPGSQTPPAYLLPVQGFYPERNQARQKLSTLPAPKFRHLARDVFFELGRRIPRFVAGDIPRQGSPGMRGPPSRTGTPNGARPGSRGTVGSRGQPRQGSIAGQVFAGGADGPMQRSLQNNMIIPNKSYLVEDDDEDGESLYGLNKRDTAATTRSYGAQEKLVAEYQNKVDELETKVGVLEKQVREKVTAVDTLQTAHESYQREAAEATEQFQELRVGLEAKLIAAQALHDSLQAEIGRAQESHSEKDINIQNLRGQLDTMAGKKMEDEQMTERYAAIERESQELQQDNQELQQELLEQQRVTDEVRREAASFLQEMKTLSAETHESFEREEELAQQVHALEDQIAQWKTRFARSKAQKRAADMELIIDQPHLEGNGYLHANGVIADFHIMEYQVAIDEALRMSRMDPRGLLSHMKSVIIAVKHITEDLETADSSIPTVPKLLTRISGSACNYITATKNFVYSAGISPVSLVDASASHLTAAIVEAVHEVKMHPSTGMGEDDFVPEMSNKSSKHFSTATGSSVSDSVYSINTAARQSGYHRQPGLNANGTLTNGVYQNSTTNGTAKHTRNGSYASNNVHSRNGSYTTGQAPTNHIQNGSYNNLTDDNTHSRNTSLASSPPTNNPPPPTFPGFSPRERDDLANLTVRPHPPPKSPISN